MKPDVNEILVTTDDEVVALSSEFPEKEEAASLHEDREHAGTRVALGEWLELDDHIHMT